MVKSPVPTSPHSPSRLSGLLCGLLMALCLMACQPKHVSTSDYRSLPDEGWRAGSPVALTPQFPDSSATYDVRLVVRNTVDYAYSNLNLAVDLIDSQGGVARSNVQFTISDGFGNFLGSGFGAYYQSSVVLARGISPQRLRKVVVWPAMRQVRLLQGIVDVGIILEPEN